MSENNRDNRNDRSSNTGSQSSGPSTNRDSVPDGLEGSIMEPESSRDQQQQRPGRGDPREKPHGDPLRDVETGDRAEGNERRSDEN